MVFRCRKNFVREIFVVTDNHENFLTAKISRYTVLMQLMHSQTNLLLMFTMVTLFLLQL